MLNESSNKTFQFPLPPPFPYIFHLSCCKSCGYKKTTVGNSNIKAQYNFKQKKVIRKLENFLWINLQKKKRNIGFELEL